MAYSMISSPVLIPQNDFISCDFFIDMFLCWQVNTELKQAIEKLQQKEEDFEEEEEEEEEAEEEEEIDYAGEETLDATKESISSVPPTETTPQVACEQKKPARKRKKLNNAENVVDSGMIARKSKKSKVAAVWLIHHQVFILVIFHYQVSFTKWTINLF